MNKRNQDVHGNVCMIIYTWTYLSGTFQFGKVFQHLPFEYTLSSKLSIHIVWNSPWYIIMKFARAARWYIIAIFLQHICNGEHSLRSLTHKRWAFTLFRTRMSTKVPYKSTSYGRAFTKFLQIMSITSK